MLNQGVVSAFVLVRTLSKIKIPAYCSSLPLDCKFILLIDSFAPFFNDQYLCNISSHLTELLQVAILLDFLTGAFYFSWGGVYLSLELYLV